MIGILSLIFGIVGIFTSFFYVGIFLCIVGLTLGIVGLTDCFSEKNFPLAGLLLSILGMILSVYTVVSDIDSNKLIICYNFSDKIYSSNYKQIAEALKEVKNFNSNDGMQLEWQDENQMDEPENLKEFSDYVADEKEVQIESAEIETVENSDDISEEKAVQPDREWYMGEASEDGNNVEERNYAVSENANRVLYQDENVIITYDGISEGSWGGGYDINLTVENLSQRTLTVQCRETSINGYMVEPICSIEVASGKKSRDEISIMGKDADFIPMNMVENVETKFHIFDFNDMFDSGYDTENIVIR